MEQKPLLLMDIDGVLNAFGAWERTGQRKDRHGQWVPTYRAPAHLRASAASGYQLLLNPSHPEWVEDLTVEFEPMWATMWQSRAWEFGEVAGFGVDWDWIDFQAHRPTEVVGRMTGLGVGTYKHPGIVATLGDRPGVWVDDDMTPFQHDWAARRTEAGIPTLFIQPKAFKGMTREHVDQILSFAESLDCVRMTAS